jgi:hypothetical protein
MKVASFFLLLATTPDVAFAQGNLDPFVMGPVMHPLCGLNPTFDDSPAFPPNPPFASCTTLAIGYSIAASYPDKGVDALSKLIVALSESSGWDERRVGEGLS